MRITSFPNGAALAALATVLSACPPAVEPTPPVLPPIIKSFTADKTQVTAGTAVTLTFTVERASSVELIDQTGAKVTTSGGATGGTATVNPTQSSFYVLRAVGEGGRDSAFVQVAVNEGLRDVFLVAVPAEVDSGATVTVLWSALGGTNVTLKDSSGTTLSTAESGTLELKPARSTQFDLRATGLLGPLSASASVKVRPVIKSFTADPPAAKQGEKINFAWKTAGAEAVKLSEATLGELVTITSQGSVDDGTYELTVPASFDADGGTSRPVPDNFPLRFTLEATTAAPPQTVSAQLQSYVRQGPVISSFDVPAFATEGKPASVNWTIANGYRAELLLDGALVFSTVPPATANGRFTIPALKSDVSVTLVAYDFNGLKVSQTKPMKLTGAPKVNTFTLPANIAAGGNAATAMWTTMNATLLIIRVKDGPAEFESTTPAMINAGMTALHPARTTTYVLEAYNAAGERDTLEKTVAVTTPLNAVATPNPTAPNSLVLASYDVSLANPADVIGVPAEPPVSNVSPTLFVDIDGLPGATKLQFSASNDATTSFTTTYGFVVPVAGTMVSTFSASTNGFLALGATTTSTAGNVDLKGSTGLPAFSMLAPFWDDLDLGADGSVQWQVDGTAFPRRLIVQWTHAHIAGEPTSDLTFQVQLYETGELRFEYKTLQAMGTRGQGGDATVGIFLGTAVFRGQFSYNLAMLSEQLELQWFTAGLSSGYRNILVGTANVTPGFFYKTTSGAYVWVSIPIRVFPANSVIVNEVMHTPAPGVAEGQYIELANPSSVDLDLGGLELSATAMPMTPYVIPPGTVLRKNGYLVFGQTTVAAANGGAAVDFGYGSALPIASPDTVALKVVGSLLADAGAAGPFVVSQFGWNADAGVEGTAQQREPALGGGIKPCTRTQTFGTVGSIGTPGAQNESCFPYTLSTIPSALEDVASDGGTRLFHTGLWDDEAPALVTLAMPFPYFGTTATALKVSPNGWLSTKSTETSTTNTPKTTPGSTAPVGAIAPFLADVVRNSAYTGSISNVYAQRVGNHQVVQWKNVSPFRTPEADKIGDLNFEVKLFDDGVIELHYGTMLDAPNPAAGEVVATGANATAWIENPDGGSALGASILQPNIAPNSAWRFTPKP